MVDEMTATGPYSIEFGDICFKDSGGRILSSIDRTELLAVAYDEIDGVLHKHGRADRVESWATDARKKFADGGFDELAKSLVVVSFPGTAETINELNACIATSGRVKNLIASLKEIDRIATPLSDNILERR